MIIPHIIDQFVWNNLIAEKELGPKGPSIDKISQQTLETPIRRLWQEPRFKKNVELAAKQMMMEDFTSDLLHFILES